MKVRCYFRDTESTNNVGRTDVDMCDEKYADLGMGALYEDANAEVQALLEQGNADNTTVLAVVNNA